MSLGRRAWIVFGVVLAITFAFDQGSKAWARTLPVHPASCAIAELAAHSCDGVPQPVIFNVADAALLVGVVLLLVDSARDHQHERRLRLAT